MKGSLRLGRIAGIGVFIHWTFVLLIGYVVFTDYRAGEEAREIFWSVVFVLSIFLTVFLHELGHALAAKKYSISTRDITLLPIGGVARLERFPEKPVQELVVALAGPAVNVVIALLVAIFIDFPPLHKLDAIVSGGTTAQSFFLNFMIVNLWLALFNLIPAFPMDGGRVLRALLSFRLQRHKATNIAAKVGQVLAVGFVILGLYSNPFLIVIGIFIFLGARGEAEHVSKQFLLHGRRVKDALLKEFPTLHPEEQLNAAVRILLDGQAKNFLVAINGQPIGTLGRNDIIRGLSEGKSEMTIASVMNTNLVVLDAELPLEEAWKKTLTDPPPLMLVKENGRFVGALDTENIMEFIMVRNAMQRE